MKPEHYDVDGYGIDSDTCESWYRSVTWDDRGNILEFKDKGGYWCKGTFNEKGDRLVYENSFGRRIEYTYDERGEVVTFKDTQL